MKEGGSRPPDCPSRNTPTTCHTWLGLGLGLGLALTVTLGLGSGLGLGLALALTLTLTLTSTNFYDMSTADFKKPFGMRRRPK